MDNKEYIWCFNDVALMSGIDAPLSLEYHLPFQKLGIPPGELIDHRLWLILKSEDKQHLFGFITPTALERYTEGTYDGDYLLNANPYHSVRLLPRIESRDRWIVDLSDEDGVRECTLEELSIFSELIKRNELASFSMPSDSSLRMIQRTGFKEVAQAVPDQLQLTLRTLAFGDAVRAKSYPESVSSIGGTALEVLRRVNPDLYSPDAIELMTSLDPLTGGETASIKSPQEILRISERLAPIVDTFLMGLDPEKISARIFVAHSAHLSTDWLDKTRDAEESHEKILKDTAIYLRERGFGILKSRSFDLYAEKGDERILFEIKSTTSDNLVEQGEKAIIQLLRYSIALGEKATRNTKIVVLLQYQDQESALRYLSTLAERIGFCILLYDENRPWPQRMFSLDPNNPIYF